ncbi:polysaccharide biosynthesis/export family protein [Sphingorhabdus sp. Alg239-R122]|uniref:polysaccharide biosynthesis/export family protein n=1 Tax=Sphingorhabdus sp. Alg239-R122 TaxID=2305989 RepID=UPI0013D9B129|nr:polysaccharide biosynthesis/export family protein [Sphingorhabdus sp. Alg239-R122]
MQSLSKRTVMARWLVMASACTALTACYGSRDVVSGSVPQTANILTTSAASSQSFPDAYPAYQIGPQDELSVTVFREPDLSLQQVTVDTGGRFEMALIGQVSAVGKTPQELSSELERRYGEDYLVNPDVAVNILKVNSRRLTVEGALERPGVFSMTQNTTLIGAIAMAGGPTSTAKLKEIAVFRKVDGENLVAVFDYTAIRAGEAENPQILPGDIVVVGFSGFKQGFQDFLKTAPLLGIFTRF